MFKVKDPQVILVGYIKTAKKDASREVIAVQLPPVLQLSSGQYMERTLIANVPSANYIDDTINCYMKQHLFGSGGDWDTEGNYDPRCQPGQDPQVRLTGRIKTTDRGHKLIVVELPPNGREGNTLIINVPSPQDADDVLCYLKYRVLDRNAATTPHQYDPASTV